MRKPRSAAIIIALCITTLLTSQVPVWDRFELQLESEMSYVNPLYDLSLFGAIFTAPSGRVDTINGFWDGERIWRIRFMPDEEGTWRYRTFCADAQNGGLHGVTGSFLCGANIDPHDIYRKGRVAVEKGSYFLNHEDGTPFFWLGCTAWNGALKSTPGEWERYLSQRETLGYNVIQLVSTQWRGCAENSRGEVAFSGSGRITINPGFFRLLDEKMDRVNAHGHLAGLVLLWALPFGTGMELSPGYYLPDREAILLARYMVARYGAHHVVWILGGDGQYYGELEDRWKFIGRQVFRDKPQGISTLHPHGRSWLGEVYAGEEWYEIDGYQSSHATGEGTVNFINRTIAGGWDGNPPKPVINLEPCYEQIRNSIFEDDVRNACYWSVFAAPPAGVTYGADGIWPWLRAGEKPLNHTFTPEVFTWDSSIELPGGKQIGFLGEFIRSFKWWEMVPAQEILLEQPGRKDYKKHLSVLKSRDHTVILVYFPQKMEAGLLLPPGSTYDIRWFDPVMNSYTEEYKEEKSRILRLENPLEHDAVLVLRSTE